MKTSPLHSRRGSAMIVALIISAVVAISLASYIRLGVTSQTISNRALYNNAAMNLAENGLEEAMYSINKMVADETYDWSGWDNNGTSATSAAWRRFPSATGTYTFDQNAKGYVRVYVYNYKGLSAPVIVSRATINLGGATSAPIEKWVEVTLSKTSMFANGLVAKETILFKGNNASVDSWNSDPLNNGSYDPYNAATNRNDKGSVGSVSVNVDSILVQQADIWGYVSTNNKQDPTASVGTNGSILGEDSPTGKGAPKVDPSRVATQFSANTDPIELPTPTTNIGAIATAGVTYGTAGAATTITCTNITLGGNADTITFQGDVTLIITAAENTQAIQINGNSAGIQVAANSSLKIYTAGNIDLTGKGIMNATGAPKNVQVYGTSTSADPDQNIKIAGGGAFSGVIYAPSAYVELKGDGAMYGSVVAEDIFVNGNGNFHYDESLANLTEGNPFRVGKWKELTLEDESGTTADRAGYRSKVNF